MSIKNIIILNDFGAVNGGAAQVAITTAIGLAERGYQVYYFCAVPPVDDRLANHATIRVVSTCQEEILSDPNRMRAVVQGVWNQRSAAVFRETFAQISPTETIVHAHAWIKALSYSPIHTAQKMGFPVVLTMHDYFLACPNGAFYQYPRDAICHLTPLSLNCIFTDCDARSYPQKLWRVARGFVQKKFTHATFGIKYFIAVSEFSRNILMPYLPKGAKTYLVPNPVEMNQQERVKAEDNRSFVAVGRLSGEKGLELFAKAALQLGLEAVFIGDGPLKDKLMEINPQAQFLGWLSRDQLKTELQKARALVFCAKTYETQGLVVEEAAGLGIPGIVSDVTAASERIVDGQNGLLFRSGDVADLADKLKCMDDPAYVHGLSVEAYRQYWLAPNTMDNYLEKLENVYRLMISGQ